MPTPYPKCSPTEMMGLLVLLNSHKGSEDVALLADDLDLEIDEIFPALEYAGVLQLLKVSDGRATFTDLGKKLVGGTIRDRKTIIRDQLKKTTLFRTLLRALEKSPTRSLSDEELAQIVSLTMAPADEAVQNIVNWGRYADLFRYDAAEQRLVLTTRSSGGKSGSGPAKPPSPSAVSETPTGTTTKGEAVPSPAPEARTSVIAVAAS